MFKFPRSKANPAHFRIIRQGHQAFQWSDLYHYLFTLSLPKLLGCISLLYFFVNTLFALGYLASKNGIANARPGSFSDAFFFSVQTITTIGYGSMYPTTPYTHFLVFIESFLGLLGVAMGTGLMFARFSRPTARVLFSQVAVICPYQGLPTLMFRTANQRNSLIVEAQVRVSVLLPAEVTHGVTIRRLHDIKLVRSDSPLFALSWTIMHPIDEESPFYGHTPESLPQSDLRVIIVLTGLDESVSQTVHARYLYSPEMIIWNARLVDVVKILPNGDRFIDYTNFHKVEEVKS